MLIKSLFLSDGDTRLHSSPQRFHPTGLTSSKLRGMPLVPYSPVYQACFFEAVMKPYLKSLHQLEIYLKRHSGWKLPVEDVYLPWDAMKIANGVSS